MRARATIMQPVAESATIPGSAIGVRESLQIARKSHDFRYGLSQDLADHAAVYVGQTEVAALKAIGQPRVVEPKQCSMVAFRS